MSVKMNLEELGFKKNDNSEKNNKLDHLGLIIFFVLAIFFVVLSTHYELNGMEAFGRVTAYGLLFFLPWFFIKRKKNASNISAILPLILIIAAFPKLIITGEENRISLIQIESFKKGLSSTDEKFGHLPHLKDKREIGNVNFTSIYNNNTMVSESEKTMFEKVKDFFIKIKIKDKKEIISNIEVPVEFFGCTFMGKVIGWQNDDDNGISYKAVFKDNAIFSNCIFKDEVLFKYTEFNGKTDFSNNNYNKSTLFKYAKFNSEVSFAGSIFMEEANFKYSTFPQKTTFSGNKFNNNANFKYTEFDDFVDFSDTNFNEEANFKYTKFPKGVSFENSVFSASSNFKYTEFSNPLNFEGTIFNGEANFKNTTLNGEKFTNHISQ